VVALPGPGLRSRAASVLVFLSVAVLLGMAGCGQIPAMGDSGPSATPTARQSHQPVDCDYTETGTPARPVSPPPSIGVKMSGTATAVIEMTAGRIKVTLDRDNAPCTVNSFVSLAQQKFYNDTSCPRMTTVAGDGGGLFMLQCGDPTGTRSGGPGYTFPDELSGDESYPAGTVAMANSGPNTNGSQFFLVFKDSQLNPDYTVFGHLDAAGIAVLNKIAKGGVDNSNGEGDGKPLSQAKIISVTVG
jgi:peptidyl-prolyl cis-trans isomerase B (cyclophilin B)